MRFDRIQSQAEVIAAGEMADRPRIPHTKIGSPSADVFGPQGFLAVICDGSVRDTVRRFGGSILVTHREEHRKGCFGQTEPSPRIRTRISHCQAQPNEWEQELHGGKRKEKSNLELIESKNESSRFLLHI
jgi:hypothetical protein